MCDLENFTSSKGIDIILEIKYLLLHAGTVVYSYAYFGRGSVPILLSSLGCTGEEQSLLDCYHSGIGIHHCSHREDAGVRCPGKNLVLIILHTL